MLRDRLLGRLGTNTERYENMLSASEYEEWEYQKHILKRLETGDTEDAKRLLGDYSACVCENDRLRMQFILTVQARIMKRQRADACCVRALLPHEEELGAVYGQALKLTVPAADCDEIQKMCLSIQELSLMLEYKRYHCADTVCGCYRNIINYIDNSNMDDKEKARIYPKAVYYYLRQEFLQGFLRAGEDNSGYLDVCNEAVRLLKRTGKTYYLWELLEIKDRILANTAAFWRKLGKKNEAAKWMQLRTGNRRWLVTAKTAGTVAIVASANGLSAGCVVTIKNCTLMLSSETATVARGKTLTLRATATPAATVTWRSGNTSVATVSNGVVRGVKAGTVNIMATANGITKICRVTVK